MLTVHHLTKSFGVTPLFENCSFSINPGEKIGLVGPNGCGKTTLLRILTGEIPSDAGVVTFTPPALRVGYLPQGVQFDPAETIHGYTQKMCGDLDALSTQLADLAAQLSHQPNQPALQQQYDSLLERIAAADESTALMQPILASLGLDGLDPALPVSALSGGQKTRLGLAGILLSSPKLLLLDEPTNHLDLQMLEWLESWLAHSPAAALIVSHDRVFLDRVVTQIFEMDPQKKTLCIYPGNYSAYLIQKEMEYARRLQEYSDQQEEIQRLTSAARHLRGIATFKKGGKADSGDKFARGFFANRGLETVRRARSVEARVEKMLTTDHIDKPHAGWQMKMEFTDTPESGRDVLVMQNLSVGYDGLPLLSGISRTVHFGDRLALTGPNGCGKTTLLRTVAGVQPPLAGKCRLGAGVIAGYMRQEQEELDPAYTVLDTLQRSASLPETDARAYLHKYLFSGDEVFLRVSELSYGQRSRLSLACLVASGCNFLLLDEPLNHLDLPSRARFEQALAGFEGTVLAVVHDRYFLQRYATRRWEIREGKIMEIG